MVMSVGLMTLNYIQCRRYGYKGSGEGWSVAQIGHAARNGIWSILAPLVILGGIYSGFFTPTESAAWGCSPQARSRRPNLVLYNTIEDAIRIANPIYVVIYAF